MTPGTCKCVEGGGYVNAWGLTFISVEKSGRGVGESPSAVSLKDPPKRLLTEKESLRGRGIVGPLCSKSGSSNIPSGESKRQKERRVSSFFGERRAVDQEVFLGELQSGLAEG